MSATTISVTRTATAARRMAIISRLQTAFVHPGFLSGLASLAMYGGAPMAVLPAQAAEER